MNGLHSTRFPGLCYQKQAPGHWRFIDTSDGEREAAVGPPYNSEKELLSDLERFAENYGLTPRNPHPSEAVASEAIKLLQRFMNGLGDVTSQGLIDDIAEFLEEHAQ